MAEVQIKATQIVRPSEKTWTGRMTLTEIDVGLAKGFVPKLYLYKPNKAFDAASISQTLKESLGKALVHFYPFAGRLTPTEGGRCDLVVDDAANTWGVPFVEAETDVEVAELGDDLLEAEANGRFRNLYSMVDYGKPLQELPLLMVKITHFRCGGVGVAITWSHAVVDGLGAGHFYSEWCRLARGEPLGTAPVHDRSLLRAGEPPRSVPEFIEQEAAPPLPPPTTVDSRTTSVKLPVSKSQINKLKQAAGDLNNGRRPYTRVEVLTAHVWRCASKARGNEGKKLNAIGIAIDIRKRINPPLPRAFNGNAVMIVTATSDSEDLVSKPLSYICDTIRRTLDKVTDELVWSYLDHQKALEDLGAWRGVMTPEGVFTNPDVLMVSWMNLSFNNLNFGWGNEAHMACMPQSLEGVACLLDDREQGSAVAVICLKVAHVDKFKEYFFDELK